jgi:hypothetical protein
MTVEIVTDAETFPALTQGSVEFALVRKYRTPNGEPTCAVNIQTGHSCLLLGSKCFGSKDICLLDSDTPLLRRGDDGLGYLIPSESCPFWKE